MRFHALAPIALGICLFAGLAFAPAPQPSVPPAPGRTAPMQSRLDELFNRLDTNGDGVIDRHEQAAAPQVLRQGLRDRHEGNRERAKTPRQRRPMRDLNGPIAHRMRERLQQFDANKDGTLDEQERAAARETVRAKVRERFDKNKDGVLDDDERAMARQAIRHKIIKRFLARQRGLGGHAPPGPRFEKMPRRGPQSMNEGAQPFQNRFMPRQGPPRLPMQHRAQPRFDREPFRGDMPPRLMPPPPDGFQFEDSEFEMPPGDRPSDERFQPQQ